MGCKKKKDTERVLSHNRPAIEFHPPAAEAGSAWWLDRIVEEMPTDEIERVLIDAAEGGGPAGAHALGLLCMMEAGWNDRLDALLQKTNAPPYASREWVEAMLLLVRCRGSKDDRLVLWESQMIDRIESLGE